MNDKNSASADLKRLLIKLAVIALGVFLVGHFVLGIHLNHGNQMYPAVRDGDLLITYKLDSYRTGDVVLFKDPASGKVRISRIAAKGSCSVGLSESGKLTIDGYVSGETSFYPTEPLEGSDISFPYSLKEGELFLLDDLRTAGKDSRIFGGMNPDEVLGKVIFVIRRRGI